MRWIKIAVASLNQTPLDWSGNRARAVEAVARARAEGAGLVVLPEMALTGYGCEDAFHGIRHSQRALASLVEFAAAAIGIVAIVGLPVRLDSGLYNGAAVIVDGRIAGIALKQNLAGDGVHYEPRWFRPWPRGQRSVLAVGGVAVPVGDLLFEIGGVRIGIEICEDAWVADRPGIRMARAATDIIASPSASHFAFGKARLRERIVTESSRSLGCIYAYTNLLGNEAGRMIYDGDRLIAVNGAVAARGRRLTFDEVALTTAVVDLDVVRMRRARTTSFAMREDSLDMVEMAHAWPAPAAPPAITDEQAEWERGPHVKEEEFARAVALGLFDYVRKSKSGGFVVSLSGGADSAAVAALASLAYRLAVHEQGEACVAARLAHMTLDPLSLSGGLLDTVYQATDNSGEVTRAAAAKVARGVGARHSEWAVQALVDHHRANVEGTLGRPLAWSTDDIALQNIQARVRAPGVWMLANVRRALLLSTSNRSEAAVGYATMDGDTAGSLAPIAGIDKNFLRHWLQWLGDHGPAHIGPLSEVLAVTSIPPTAELRPAAQHQTDEADLMPYDLLDAIELLAIRDRLDPGEVVEMLDAEWAPRVGGAGMLRAHVRKFFTLWSRNQWKRERFAPSFHLDDENLDPRTWCRFPIISAGYEEEMREL